MGLVPLERWDIEPRRDTAFLNDARMPPRFGAYLANPGDFDPPVFGLSSAEVALIDPQQRLLLECIAEAMVAHRLTASSTQPAAEALRSFSAAASRGDQAAGASTGVFVGIASSDYGALLQRHTVAGGLHATGCSPSLASGRLSFAFGFGGPSISIGARPHVLNLARGKAALARNLLHLSGRRSGGGQALQYTTICNILEVP